MTPLRPVGWHAIDDFGHTTQTVPVADEWAVEHLPLTTVALAAAVPVIEAELRERIAGEIEAHVAHLLPGMSEWDSFHEAAAVARGQS